MSSYLYYGPGAELASLEEAKLGRPLGGPFGKKGLKIEEAREIIALLNNLPPGRTLCTVVIGPLDKATPAASDVLLKTLEEPPEKARITLWARDILGVSPTITSRCWPKWVYGQEATSLGGVAKLLVESLEQNLLAESLKILQDNKDSLEELSMALSFELSSREVFSKEIWGRLKKALTGKLTYLSFSTALLFEE